MPKHMPVEADAPTRPSGASADTHQTRRPPLQLPAPLSIRLLALGMSCVFSGLGLLALISGHTEGRWTRHGYAGPLEGTPAHAFGLSMFFFGLLPLALAMRTPRAAQWLGGLAVTLGLLSVFAGPFLLG